MEYERHYFKQFNLIWTIHPEEITDRNIQEHMLALIRETKGIEEIKELSDCRQIIRKSSLTVRGVIEAAKLDKIGPKSTLAILIPDRAIYYGMARVYETFVKEKRKEVKIFTSLQPALEWFGFNDKEVTELHKIIEPNGHKTQKGLFQY